MIATVPDHNARIEQLLPAIERQARVAFRGLPASRLEERMAEVVANAFCTYRRLVERGKPELAYATPLAQFAIRQIRSGRRVGGKLKVRDVSSCYCQRRQGLHLERLDRFDASDDCWEEVVVEDKTAGPADIATFRIDFSCWLSGLTPRLRRIAQALATGESTSAAARRFRLSRARISQLRRELQDAWRAFQGERSAASCRRTRRCMRSHRASFRRRIDSSDKGAP